MKFFFHFYEKFFEKNTASTRKVESILSTFKYSKFFRKPEISPALSLPWLSWQGEWLRNHLGIYSFFFLSDDFLEKHKIQIRNGLPLAPLVISLAGSWEGGASTKMIQASLVKYLGIFTLSVYKYLFSKMCNRNH